MTPQTCQSRRRLLNLATTISIPDNSINCSMQGLKTFEKGVTATMILITSRIRFPIGSKIYWKSWLELLWKFQRRRIAANFRISHSKLSISNAIHADKYYGFKSRVIDHSISLKTFSTSECFNEVLSWISTQLSVMTRFEGKLVCQCWICWWVFDAQYTLAKVVKK